MAANLRILNSNTADSCTITAGSGNATAPNMLLDFKSAVWRSAAGVTTALITMQWASAKFINMVALAFTNLSSTATLRFRGYTLAGDASPATDVTRSSFLSNAITGQVHACVFTPATDAFEKVTILITDTSNTDGYLEVSRIIAGVYWSPTYTAEMGASIGIVDTSKSERTDSGDLFTDRGRQFKTMSFDMSVLTSTDRNKFYNILTSNGTYKPMFITLTPEDSVDKPGEMLFQIYGKLVRTPAMKYAYFEMFSTQVDIEEV